MRVPDIVIPDAGMINAYLPNHAVVHAHALEFTFLKDALAAQDSHRVLSSPCSS